MNGDGRPIAFVATDDPAASGVFYRDRLGLTLVECSPYALVFQDGGTMLRVQIVEAFVPADHTVHGWDVGDIRQVISKLHAKGTACLRFTHLDQDDAGVWTTPQGDKIAWFSDPCGNILSLTQFNRP